MCFDGGSPIGNLFTFTSATTMSNWQLGFSASLPFLVLSCILLIECLLGKDVTLSLKIVKHL